MRVRSDCCRVYTELIFEPDIGTLLVCPACGHLCAPQNEKLTIAQNIAAVATGNVIGDMMLKDALTELARWPLTNAEVIIFCPVHQAIHTVIPYRDPDCVEAILSKWGIK